MAIADPAKPRPMDTFGVGDARDVAFAGDHLAAVSGEYDSLSVPIFPVDGSGGVHVPIKAEGVTALYDIEVSGGCAYVASHNYVGIIDATVPAKARVVFEWTPPASTGNPANTFVADGVGYFAAGWDGLYVFDVTNPAAPALLGHWISPDWVIDLVVVEGIAYATLGDTGVAAVDLTEPANPRLLGLVTVPGFAGSIDVAQGRAFVGWHGASGSLGGIAVIDMTDPAAPTLVDTFGRFSALNHLEVSGDHLFVSDESEGLVVFRITGAE